MKFSISIWLLFISISALGQGEGTYTQLKSGNLKNKIFYAPYFRSEVSHSIQGIGNLMEPADSISFQRIIVTGRVEEKLERSLIEKSNLAENILTVLVDTSLIAEKEIDFFRSFRLNKIYSSYPRTLRTKRNGRLYSLPLTKDTAIKVVSQPVFIANLSDDIRYLVGYSGHLTVTQQAKDKEGNWKDIEVGFPIGCSMVRYICELKKNDFVLTTVLRFQGSFQTLLRIKLETDSHTFYSDSFAGYINYEQINNPKIKIIDNDPYERN